MKTIKLIDLLNMLAKGEFDKLPKKLNYLGTEITLEDGCYWVNTYEKRSVTINLSYNALDREFEIMEGASILDDEEKKYLGNIIKPFRDKVKCLTKLSDCVCECIVIDLNTIREEYIELPYFEQGEMYKGMEPDREYTLEELGL